MMHSLHLLQFETPIPIYVLGVQAENVLCMLACAELVLRTPLNSLVAEMVGVHQVLSTFW
jgi:hypothetical protein